MTTLDRTEPVLMADSTPAGHAASALPRLPWAVFLPAWAIFWLLLVTVGVQDYLRQGGAEIWKPLLWEGSSCVVASALVAVLWRRIGRLDRLLTRPWRWFAAGVIWLPPAALGFVIAVYGLRHGVYLLLGQSYRHESWSAVFVYETVKFSIFYLLFMAVFFGIRSHALLSAERIRTERALALSRHAQLLQLAQQIEPHFLFNALNTIASTIHSDPELADSLLTKLAALLRAATDLTRQPETSLDEELRLLESYASIMQERFADRSSVRFEIDAQARSCRVPTLALQPLLENAFRHVVEHRSGLTAIVVRARREASVLVLEVEDDGGVLGTEARFGVGLSNLRDRLAARHGAAATLRLSMRDSGGVVARMELPCGC